jgi:hypothetical protein
MTDYKEKLKKYKFRDALGHPLENCADYENLLRAAGKTISDLPDFETAQLNVEANSASAIERFIYEHEPAGAASSSKFRQLLLAALNQKEI